MSARWELIPLELAVALRVLLREGTLDVAIVCQREGLGFDGPRVKAHVAASKTLEMYAAPDDKVARPEPPLSYRGAVYLLPVRDRDRIIAAIKGGA